MKPNYTDIIMVLDRSGSMESVRQSTIEGVNSFLAAQKKIPGEARITLIQFSDNYHAQLNAIPIQSAFELNEGNYVPYGGTALYGAIGKAMSEAGDRFAAQPESERPEKVVMVIITDGEENSSQRHTWSCSWTRHNLADKIAHQRDRYKWEFVYIGANQDAILNASQLSIAGLNSLNYTANRFGTERLYTHLSSNMAAYRCATKADMSWEADQIKAQADAVAKP